MVIWMLLRDILQPIILFPVYHNVRCAVCYTKPIKGLRYICMRCLSYDLCQNCFFTGKKSKRHLAHHEIREFCAKVIYSIQASLFILNWFNIFWRSNQHQIRYYGCFRQVHVRQFYCISKVCSGGYSEGEQSCSIYQRLQVTTCLSKWVWDYLQNYKKIWLKKTFRFGSLFNIKQSLLIAWEIVCSPMKA